MLAQLVRALACHARGHGFEFRASRQNNNKMSRSKSLDENYLYCMSKAKIALDRSKRPTLRYKKINRWRMSSNKWVRKAVKLNTLIFEKVCINRQ